jgi:hypothetical protein
MEELADIKHLTKRSPKRIGKGIMTSFGGYKQRYGRRQTRISFCTYKRSLHNLFDCENVLMDYKVSKFQAYLNKLVHMDLLEMIIACHMFYNPSVAREFLLANSCYLDESDFEAKRNDEHARRRVAGIQMFISIDYASRIHTDLDHSSHSLSYVSSRHSGTCAKFPLASHGIVIPLEDGDLYSFRGKEAHGTILESASEDETYVACLTTNQSFGNQIGL